MSFRMDAQLGGYRSMTMLGDIEARERTGVENVLPAALQLGTSSSSDTATADPRARRLTAVLAFGRRASARPEPEVLFQDALSIVMGLLGAPLGSMARIGDDASSINLEVFQAEAGSHATSCGRHRSSLEPGDSLAAYALHSGSVTVATDLGAEPRFQDAALSSLHVASALCCPLPMGDRPYGTLSVYFREPRCLALEEVQFAESIVHLLTASLGRSLAEQQCRLERLFAQGAIDSADEPLVIVGREGTMLRANAAMVSVSGFSPAELIGRSFYDALAEPRERQTLRGLVRGVVADRTSRDMGGTLLTCQRKRLPVRWTLRMIAGANGAVQAVMLTARKPSEPPEESSEAERRPSPQGEELRSSPRVPYQYLQWIAPSYNGKRPRKNELFQVPCRDISAGGISFYIPQPPDFEVLVVGLGQMPSLTLFGARVVRVVPEDGPDGPRYLVGCAFTGRTHID